jgi:hypothetical protein
MRGRAGAIRERGQHPGEGEVADRATALVSQETESQLSRVKSKLGVKRSRVGPRPRCDLVSVCRLCVA